MTEAIPIETNRSPRRYRLLGGDCLDILRRMRSDSMDSLVSDPPGAISFMGKDWDDDRGGRDAWIDWLRIRMREAWRVLKPGAHGLVWALPRTSHWTALALEKSGFEVRDRVAHLFGSGFPKSLDMSKGIDRRAGAIREIIGPGQWNHVKGTADQSACLIRPGNKHDATAPATAPANAPAKQWQGWGTALKPAVEDWWLIRKPFEDTVAANVLQYGTGALNIDGCRIGGVQPSLGRWPAHLVFSHGPNCKAGDCADGCPVKLLDDQSGVSKSTGGRSGFDGNAVYGEFSRPPIIGESGYGDEGGASRYFTQFHYTSKASTREREAGCEDLPALTHNRKNHHPTVKSVKMMRWLCRLITPPGGLCLDPFAGSGSTGVACMAEGFRFIGVELEPQYLAIAEARIAAAVRP